MRISENILISSLTTMRLGGMVRYVVEVETPEEVPEAYKFAAERGLPVFILGYGANTIGRDEGYPGVIVINRMRGIELVGADGSVVTGDVTVQNDNIVNNSGGNLATLRVMGGEYWDNVVAYTVERELTGIEALSKIPGLAGAAPVQNIGAYGQEVADTLVEILVYDTMKGEFKVLSREDLNFSYRHSILNTTEKGRYFVVSITLRLRRGQMERPFYNSIEQFISERGLTDFSPRGMREIVSTIRADKLPDPREQASSGSFFQNVYLDSAMAEVAESKGYPVHRGRDGNKLSAAWLIEQAGFKGKLLHGMRVSEKAPLVLINESAKSYKDLASARAEIINKVYDKFGYWLVQEPVEISF